jgi:outer membrane protein assembly factor BamB
MQTWRLVLLGFLISTARADDWPQFLGPARDATSTDPTPLATTWPGGEPKLAWEMPVGTGWAGPAVADNWVLVFHREGTELVLESRAAKDGAKQWRTTWPCRYRDQFGFDNGPRSTPTVAGGRVFAYGPAGELLAVELATGKQLWRRELAQELEAPAAFFGRRVPRGSRASRCSCKSAERGRAARRESSH